MSNIIFFDDDNWDHLLPLTYTRPTCMLRTGILTIKEKWEKHLGMKGSFITKDHLADKYPIHIAEDNFLINGGLLPTPTLLAIAKDLEPNEALLNGDQLIIARLDQDQFNNLADSESVDELVGLDVSNHADSLIKMIRRPYDLFAYAKEQLEMDYELLTAGRESAPIHASNTVVGDRIFLEEGATVTCAMLNATDGPIYVGKDATIMEGAMVRGGLGLCDHATVKMGAKLYGANTIGPWSKVGGEVGNSVILGYSNKGHDGYLGNSVLGEWCNLGADTNTSNLKNNYSEVRLWSYVSERFEATGHQFCGLIMGDHSKCGINTMFNTGTVVGVSCNIFGGGYPRNYIPSFSWGGSAGFKPYRLDKALEVAEIVMARRKVSLSSEDVGILNYVHEKATKQ